MFQIFDILDHFYSRDWSENSKSGLELRYFSVQKFRGIFTWPIQDVEWIWPNHDNKEPKQLNMIEIETDKP